MSVIRVGRAFCLNMISCDELQRVKRFRRDRCLLVMDPDRAVFLQESSVSGQRRSDCRELLLLVLK